MMHSTDRRTAVRSFIVCLVAGVVAALPVAAAAAGSAHTTGRGVRTTRVAGAAGYDPRTLPALPATTATGPAVPDVRGIVLDGSLALSTSLEPTLKWGSGQVTFTITDLAGKTVWSGSGTGQARVGAGKLSNGGVYQWQATDAAGTTSPEHQFRVDTQISETQTQADFGGISVASVTGEPLISIGALAATLQYRSTNATSAFHSVGVPAAWRLTTSADAPWLYLRRVSATQIELASASGVTVPFRQSSPGAWVATWGAGQSWPAGSYATLSQSVVNGAPSGDFQITERSGTVVAFPDTPVGQTSRPSASWAARSPEPAAHYDATGRLITLTDPITGHVVTLHYGGSGTCHAPHAGTGLKSAPAGYLCSVSQWDGERADIFYREHDLAGTGPLAGPQIGRVDVNAQAAGKLVGQLDLGYDAAGRLATTRDALANAAIASGVLSAAGVTAASASSPNVITQIVYDSRGRVASITRPAALQAGSATIPARAARSFTYGATDGTLTVSEPGTPGALSVTVSDPKTFLVSSTTDTDGLKTTTTWDTARQLPLTQTQPGGLITKYEYDASGRIVSTIGPTTSPATASAPKVSETYDTHETSQGRAPTNGLLATYWKGTTMQGAPAGAAVGPKINGAAPTSLQFDWTAIGPNHPFAARLEGTISVPTGGITGIAATGATQLWIDGISCPGACPATLDLAARKAGERLQIRIDVQSSASGIGGVNVTWVPTGKSATAIPIADVHPMIPNPTATTVRDQLGATGGVIDLTSDMVYSASDPSELVSTRSASHAVATRQYEQWAPQSGHFTRATGAVSAAGRHWSTTYYAKGEGPAVDCPGAAANQQGMPKTHTSAGGLVTTNAYDLSGDIVGQLAPGGVKTCTAFDAAGNVVSVTRTNNAGDGTQSTVVYEPIADNNPLVSRTDFPGTSYASTTTTTDLLGRVIAATDTWGATTSITYDKDDQPIIGTVRTAKGEQSSVTTSYNRDGSVNQVARDGTVLATASYQSSTGLLTGVAYGNGATLALGYDHQGNAVLRTLTIGGKVYTERASVAPSGRTLGLAITSPDTAANWAYSYDKDSRLTAAALTGTLPAGAAAGTWAYALDAAGQRTRITSPSTSAEGYTYTYNEAGAITSTTDPRFAGGFAYDAQGRATKAGPLAFTYGQTGDPTSITDGTVRTDQTYLPDGTQISQTITTGATANSANYAIGGLVLDTSGAIASQALSLPGAVSVQLPAPVAAGATATGTATWRYSDLSGSIGWQSTDASAPATTQLYDPDGNRLSGQALSTDPKQPNLAFEGSDTAPLSIPVSVMGARDYVAALGIFLQADPVPDSGLTAYNYANSDPINLADTSGNASFFSAQWWKENWIGITVAVVTTVIVTVATAGTATTAAAGLWAGVLKGAAIGAATSAASDAATQGIELATGHRESFDFIQLGVATGIGAVLGGGIGGRAGAKQAARMKGGFNFRADQAVALAERNADLAAEGGKANLLRRFGNRIGAYKLTRPAGGEKWSMSKLLREIDEADGTVFISEAKPRTISLTQSYHSSVPKGNPSVGASSIDRASDDVIGGFNYDVFAGRAGRGSNWSSGSLD